MNIVDGYMMVYWIIFVFAIMFGYLTHCPCISFVFISNKYRSFQKLNGLVSKEGMSKCKACRVSMSMIMKCMYLYFIQYMNNSVVQVRKNVYDVSYIIGNNKYIMRVKRPKGPNPVMLAYDEDDNDVTDMVHSYLGPHRDWHGNQFTPSMFGVESITLETINNSVSYGPDEVLTV